VGSGTDGFLNDTESIDPSAHGKPRPTGFSKPTGVSSIGDGISCTGGIGRVVVGLVDPFLIHFRIDFFFMKIVMEIV